MLQVPVSSLYIEKFKGFNRRMLEYIQNSRKYTFNVLEGSVRSSKTVANVYAAAMAIEESIFSAGILLSKTMVVLLV